MSAVMNRELSGTPRHARGRARCYHLGVLFSRAFAMGVALLTASAAAAPAGPPKAPAESAPKLTQLPAHALAYAPSPLDNPLKGFVPFYAPGKTYANKFPLSMEWSYFALNDLMKGPDTFDWSPLERMLNEVAARGRHSVLRVYTEYPGKPSAIPEFLRKSGVKIRKVPRWNNESPDYDDPRTQQALISFIKAFGKKYDGDPRIGFLTVGLIGLWGEWHMWPADELLPKDETLARYIDAFDEAFDKTQIEIRYPTLARGYPVRKNLGFHDDSMFFREEQQSITLPKSLGGKEWAFLQGMLDFGAENRWTEQSIGGEARPEIQRALFKDNKSVEDPLACVELSHVTWLMNQAGFGAYKPDDPRAGELVRKMGYELHVSEARFADVASSSALRVGVTIENRGVAPFYYPWRVVVALANEQNQIARSWYTAWDLREIQPKSIAVFPDWKLPGDPKQLPFGSPRHFSVEIANHGLAPGKYRVLMRVVNPLELSAKSRGGARPLPLRFANASQLSNGWLGLGELAVLP
jgi:hypothetical protein